MARRQNRFVIGIGSMRAGTTQLHQVLDTSPDVFAHPLKELHYFDSVALIRDFDFMKRHLRFIAAPTSKPRSRLAAVRRTLRLPPARERLKAEVQATAINRILACDRPRDLNRIPYVELFGAAAHTRRTLAEITPEYMLLDDVHVARMAAVTGSETRIILLRRDPLDRILSSFVLKRAASTPGTPPVVAEEDLWHTMATEPWFLKQQFRLSDYASAEATYKRHFDHVLALEFTDLISGRPAVARTLADFLGVRLNPRTYLRVVTTPTNSFGSYSFSPEVKHEIQRRLDAYFADRGRPNADPSLTGPHRIDTVRRGGEQPQ